MSRRCYWLAALVLCAGCLDPARTWSYDEFTAELGVLACLEEAECDNPAMARFSSVQRCVRLDGKRYVGVLSNHLVRGETVFEASAAAQCLDWVARHRQLCRKAHDPWNWSEQASPCLAVFVGQLALGQRCWIDFNCASKSCIPHGPCHTLRCQPSRKEGELCPAYYGCGPNMHCGNDGFCHSYHQPGSGAKCDTDWECAAGLSCAGDKCRPPQGLGTLCTAWSDERLACGKGLVCGAIDGDMRCVVAGAVGSECSAVEACVWGLVCDSGICQQPALDGQPCSKARANCTCEDRSCLPDPSGKLRCVSLPDVGDKCAPAGSATPKGHRCQLDLFCDPVDQICRKQSGRGQACAGNHECWGGMSCVGGKCAQDGLVGDACDAEAPWTCRFGLWCSDGKCAAKLGGGGACGNSQLACAPGLVCANGMCRIGGGQEAACNSANPCAHGLECIALTCQEDPCADAP